MEQRVIKFRVWDTQLNLWVNNIGMKVNNVLTDGTEKRFKVMQFTGLKDKNGKEIYEKDIVKDLDGNLMTCVWDQDACEYQLVNDDGIQALTKNCCEWVEVIGNIFEEVKDTQR